jgi:hypothetical protein
MHTYISHLHKIPFFFKFLFPSTMFGRLLGLGSFGSPKGPLVHKQASLPITFNGIGLISTTTITPIVYLRSWALVALVIVVRFMVNHTSFPSWSFSMNRQQHIFFPTTLQGGMWSSTAPNQSMSSSIWTTHWATNDSTSRFHLEMFAPSHLLEHLCQWDV